MPLNLAGRVFFLAAGTLLILVFGAAGSAAAEPPSDFWAFLLETLLVSAPLLLGVRLVVLSARVQEAAAPPWLRNPAFASLIWIGFWLFVRQVSPQFAPMALMLAFTPLGLCLLLLVHESGHALAALLLRFEIHTFQVGPVRLDLRRRSVTMAWSVWEDFDGAVTHEFGRGEHWRLRRSLVLLAGPLANLATGIPLLRLPAGGRAAAMVGITLALLNLLPVHGATGTPTDGRRIVDLLLHGRAVRLKEQILRETATGKRPREWTVTLVELMDAASSADQGWTLLFAYSRALDTGAVDLADRLLVRGLRDSTGGVRTEFLLQGAIFHALIDADPDRARDLLEDGISSRDPTYCRLAEAAVLLAEGHVAEARAARDHWLEALRQSESPNLRKGSNEWAMDRLEERLGTPASPD